MLPVPETRKMRIVLRIRAQTGSVFLLASRGGFAVCLRWRIASTYGSVLRRVAFLAFSLGICLGILQRLAGL